MVNMELSHKATGTGLHHKSVPSVGVKLEHCGNCITLSS
jgi:hypothetical protein